MDKDGILHDIRGKSKWIAITKVLLFCILCAITLAITSGLTKSINKLWAPEISLAIAIIITIALTVAFVSWDGLTLRFTGIIPGKYTLKRVLLGILIGSFIASLQPLILLATGYVQFIYSGGVNSIVLINSFCLYILVAIREEIAFRGYPIRRLNKEMGLWFSLIIIAVIFFLEHIIGGMTIIQALIGPAIGSLLFGIAALSTKGLALPVGLHFAWNFCQWVFGFKDNTGIWHINIIKGYESQVQYIGYIAYFIGIGLGIIGFYLYWRKFDFK